MTINISETASPITKAARDLTEILSLHAALIGQAIHQGGAAGIPGGEAMVALGNVSNVEAWGNYHQATERHDMGWDNYRRVYTAAECEDPDDAWSAYQLIEFWSEAWRTERGDDHDGKRTLRTEVNYVRHSLEWAWETEPHFEEFAADMRRARLRLEDIVYDGKRVERTRVLCDRTDCDNPRRLIKLHAIYDPTGIFDTYKCPGCGERFTEDEYRRAYRAMLKSEGADRELRLAEAVAILKAEGRGERTIRRWLSPLQPRDLCTECGEEWPHQEYACCPMDRDGEECGGLLTQTWVGDRDAIVGRAYCDVATHAVMVWWPDLWSKHNATRKVKVTAA